MPSHRLSSGALALSLVTLTLVVSCGEDDFGGPTHTTPNPQPIPNPSPIAAFRPACNLLRCTFTDSSTDDEAVTAWSWDFGDGTDLSTEENPVHTYATEAQYRVTLTVRDNEGASDSVFTDIAVSESPECVDASTPDDFIPCRLLIPYGNSVWVSVSSESDCTVDGDTLRIMPPFNEEVLTDACHAEKGARHPMIGGNPFLGNPTVLYLAITLESDDADRVTPSVLQQGGYPQWTIRLDDGGHPKDPNEPDFNDLVITVNATSILSAPTDPNPWDYLRQLTQVPSTTPKGPPRVNSSWSMHQGRFMLRSPSAVQLPRASSPKSHPTFPVSSIDQSAAGRSLCWPGASIWSARERTSVQGNIREARLKPEFAANYPGIEAGVWLPATVIGQQLLLWHLTTPAIPQGERLLSEEHFEFRGGRKRVGAWVDARTRMNDG